MISAASFSSLPEDHGQSVTSTGGNLRPALLKPSIPDRTSVLNIEFYYNT